MAKTTGLGDHFYLDGYDLSGDIGSIDLGAPVETLDDPGLNVSAMERLGGKRDGSMEFLAYFNPASNQAHPRLASLPTADVIGTYLNGAVVGNAGAGIVAKEVNYDGSRGDDGSFTFKTTLSGAGYGINWGEQLTTSAQLFASSPGTGTVLDYGAGVGTTNFGLQAFLHVISVAGTSATVAIQSSTDNAGDAYANITGAVFAAATPGASPQAQRIATGPTAAVERYLRINATGTFTNLTCVVIVCRNLVATVF